MSGTTTSLNPSTTGVHGAADAAHTPGPWRPNGVAVTTRVGFKECVVCDMNTSAPCGGGTYDRELHLPEYRANARLIAAAPELLRELQTSRCPGGGWTGMPADIEPTVENCLAAGNCGCTCGAAIAKATGAA